MDCVRLTRRRTDRELFAGGRRKQKHGRSAGAARGAQARLERALRKQFQDARWMMHGDVTASTLLAPRSRRGGGLLGCAAYSLLLLVVTIVTIYWPRRDEPAED